MEKNTKKNFIIVLGNNQDSCLLTGDNNDVTEFLQVHNNELNSLREINRENFRIKTGMNICAAYLKNSFTKLLLWGKIGDNETGLIKLEFPDIIKKCSLGDSHILLLSMTGDVYVTGEANHGQLGLAEQIRVDKSSMTKLQLKTKITKIYAGIRTSFFLDGT
jgi:hypothetical protein